MAVALLGGNAEANSGVYHNFRCKIKNCDLIKHSKLQFSVLRPRIIYDHDVRESGCSEDHL